MRRPAALLLAAFAAAAAAQQPTPRTLYLLHCAGCHALDGSGVPEKGVPSLRGSLGQFMRSAEGRAFLVQVPGVNNAGLSDAQIAEVTNWTVRQFSAETAPSGSAPCTAAEVAEARKSRPVDVARARAALVERSRAEGIELPSAFRLPGVDDGHRNRKDEK